MKVRSTIPLPFSADRAGVHLAIIEIDFQITQRNDIDKSYSLYIDYTINDHITIAIRNSMPESMRLQYIDSPGRREIGRKTTLKVTRSMIIKERTFFYGYIWTYRI
jgi:hypothetical protein